MAVIDVSPQQAHDVSRGLVGKAVSHFRVQSVLGAGGMGVVYRAVDLELERNVALKFLPAERTRHERSRRRLVREAQSASRIDHPNVCSIHEIGRTREGDLFIAMAYYEGETLKRKLARSALSQEQSLDIAVQLAAGLGAAHARAVVHRDVKPGNIMITRAGEVKILGFGLALLGQDTPSTAAGAAGTFLYMSPEQARCRSVDERSDLWALGAVLYEMLTGVPPFLGGSPASTIRKILHARPRPLLKVRPTLHQGFDKILRRCFVKNPMHRYQRAIDIESDLLELRDVIRDEDWLTGDSTARLTPVHHSPAGRWSHSIAVLPFRNESAEPEQEYFCSGVTDEIMTALGSVSGLRVIARPSSLSYRATTKSDLEIAEELDVAHILRGRIYKAKGDPRIRVNAELYSALEDEVLWRRSYQKDLEDIFSVQKDLARTIAGTLELVVTPFLFDDSDSVAMDYEVWEAIKKSVHFTDEFFFRAQTQDFKHAVKYGEWALRRSPQSLAAHVALAYTYSIRAYLAGRLADLLADSPGTLRTRLERTAARIVHHRCISRSSHHAERAFQVEPESSMSLAARGGVCHLRGQHEQAFDLLSQAIRVNPNHALAIHLLGRTVGLGFGLHDEAVRYFDRAIDLNPRSPFPHHNRGFAYLNLGQLEAASEDFLRALELQPNDHTALGGWCELAILDRDFDSARECIRRMELIRPRTAGLYKRLLRAAECRKTSLAITRPKEAMLAGSKDLALRLLGSGPGEPTPGYLELKHHPIYAEMAADVRFRGLLRERQQSYELMSRRYGDSNSPLAR